MKKIFKLSFLMLLTASLFITSCTEDDDIDIVDFGTPPTATVSNGEIEVITKDNVRYHILVAFSFTSTIVETESGIVVFDTGANVPFLPNYGEEIKTYAAAIGKPISVVITHNHSDHWGNIDKFVSYDVYAETECANSMLTESGFNAIYTGTLNKVESGSSVSLYGLTYEFDKISNSETSENGYMFIESTKALFAEDLVGNEWQLFLREYTPLTGEDEIDNWILGLNELKTQFGDYNYMFVGHGFPSSNIATTIDENIGYLMAAQGLIKGTRELTSGGFATTVEEVVDELKFLYPTWGTGSIDLSLPDAFYPGDPGSIWF